MSKLSSPSRTIIFTKQINDKTIAKVLKEIITVASDPRNKKQEATLFLLTNGGFTEPGFMFYDVMNHAFGNINLKTVATGEVASMGITMFLAAKPENRYVLPHTTLILHETRWVQGDEEFSISSPRLKKMLSKHERCELKETQKMYVEIVSAQTGTSKKKILELMRSDAQLSAEEAVKYGFAHKIIYSPQDY